MICPVSRAARRHAVTGSAESVADDLWLTREAGGIAEAGSAQLGATLSVLGLDSASDPDVDHARATLRALVEATLGAVLKEHPVRATEDDEKAPGVRLRQPWQAVAACSLERLLLSESGSKGQVVDIRADVAGSFGLSAATVKRYEDKLLRTLLGPRIHERLSTGSGALPASLRARSAAEETDDPLWSQLGATEAELAEALLRNARIPGQGFDAQEMGRHEPSRASTGIVTYALAMTPAIDDDVIAELYGEIASWITPDGALHRGHAAVESTWTESQCLLALTARPHLLEGRAEPRRLADALLRQQRDGGWAYRDGSVGPLHPAWTFYPLLALNRATRAEWISGLRYRDSAQRAAAHAAAALEEEASPPNQLMALAILHLASSGTDADWSQLLFQETERFGSTLTTTDAEELDHIAITDDSQPLWHARINPSLLYLHARRVVGNAHPFTQALIDRLLAEYDPINQGWSNSSSPGARTYTWTTALALRSCQVLRADIRAGFDPWRDATRDMQAIATPG